MRKIAALTLLTPSDPHRSMKCSIVSAASTTFGAFVDKVVFELAAEGLLLVFWMDK